MTELDSLYIPRTSDCNFHTYKYNSTSSRIVLLTYPRQHLEFIFMACFFPESAEKKFPEAFFSLSPTIVISSGLQTGVHMHVRHRIKSSPSTKTTANPNLYDSRQGTQSRKSNPNELFEFPQTKKAPPTNRTTGNPTPLQPKIKNSTVHQASQAAH